MFRLKFGKNYVILRRIIPVVFMQIRRGCVRQNTTVFVSSLLGWRHIYTYMLHSLSTLPVECIISFNLDNSKTTRSRWKLKICTTTNVLILYIFSLLYIFVTWGWPTVAETFRHPNKYDTKTVVNFMFIGPCIILIDE